MNGGTSNVPFTVTRMVQDPIHWGKGTRILLLDAPLIGCFGSPIRAFDYVIRNLGYPIRPHRSSGSVGVPYLSFRVRRGAPFYLSLRVLTNVSFFMSRTGTKTNRRSSRKRPMGRRRTRMGQGLRCHGESTRPTGGTWRCGRACSGRMYNTGRLSTIRHDGMFSFSCFRVSVYLLSLVSLGLGLAGEQRYKSEGSYADRDVT